MKRIKKGIKSISKKSIVFAIICAMTISCFIPIVNVLAETFGSGSHFMTVDIQNDLGFTINNVTVNGNAWANAQDKFYTDNGEYHVEIQVSGNGETGDTIPRIQYGGNWNDYVNALSSEHNENDHVLTLDLNYVGEETFLGLSIVEDDGSGYIPNEPHFDGHAYVLWSCGAGVCYHEFNDIPDFDDGNSTFYKDTTIKADNDQSKYFDVHAEYKAWVLPDDFERWVTAYKMQKGLEVIDWTQVDPEDIIAEYPPNMWEWEEAAIKAESDNPGSGCTRPSYEADWEEWNEFETCVDNYYIAAGNLPFIRLQPVGEPQYPNAYVSYGDRNFKVVIYNSDYRGVQMGDLSQLNYYPGEWTDPFVKRDQFDISGTSKENPSSITSILLENTVMIKAIDVNNFEIASVEPLDVPEGAVTVSKVGGEFRLVFSSNFYSNVVFKVTGTDSSVSYMKIKRYTIDAWFKHVDNNPVLAAEFYFDKNKSYEDFELTAKIVYKNGTSKSVKLEPYSGIDDGLGNITDAYEVESGKGLKKSEFHYSLEDGEDNQISKIYLNAEYKGSSEDNYAGAYVGSGEGELANIYMGGVE